MTYPPPLSKVRPGEKKVRSERGVYLGQGGKFNANMSRRCKKVRSERGVCLGQGRALDKGVIISYLIFIFDFINKYMYMDTYIHLYINMKRITTVFITS
jgi:hypothetical protein